MRILRASPVRTGVGYCRIPNSTTFMKIQRANMISMPNLSKQDMLYSSLPPWVGLRLLIEHYSTPNIKRRVLVIFAHLVQVRVLHVFNSLFVTPFFLPWEADFVGCLKRLPSPWLPIDFKLPIRNTSRRMEDGKSEGVFIPRVLSLLDISRLTVLLYQKPQCFQALVMKPTGHSFFLQQFCWMFLPVTFPGQGVIFSLPKLTGLPLFGFTKICHNWSTSGESIGLLISSWK